MAKVSIIPAVLTTPYATILAAEPVAIVTDVIRATTTATTAVARGNRCIPVGSVEHAREEATRRPEALLAGEQQGESVPGFHLGNSPAAVDRLEGETVILLSSSGTPVLYATRASTTVFISCLRTTTATVRAAAQHGRDIVILPACTRGEFRDEDKLLAGWTVKQLLALGYEAGDDFTRNTVDAWGDQAPSSILGSKSVKFLIEAGHQDDLDFIMERIDDLDFTIHLSEGELVRYE
jgi:2-phosphosulfolactate phosphatase